MLLGGGYSSNFTILSIRCVGIADCRNFTVIITIIYLAEISTGVLKLCPLNTRFLAGVLNYGVRVRTGFSGITSIPNYIGFEIRGKYVT